MERCGRNERGFALAVVLVLIAIVAVALVGAAAAAGYGVLSASQTRRDVDARMAATARAADGVPGASGGSVAPAAPVDGFYDFAVVDEQSGRLAVYAASDAPQSGELILRQWRVSASSGGRLFEVSATLVDASTHEAITGPRGAAFLLSRVSE